MNFSLIPIAHAQTIGGIFSNVMDVLNMVIPIIFMIATIVFLWGIVLFIISGGDEEKRKEGRQYIIYGLIGLFVMVAGWGIVNVVIGFFDIGGFGAPDVTDLPGSGNNSRWDGIFYDPYEGVDTLQNEDSINGSFSDPYEGVEMLEDPSETDQFDSRNF